MRTSSYALPLLLTACSGSLADPQASSTSSASGGAGGSTTTSTASSSSGDTSSTTNSNTGGSSPSCTAIPAPSLILATGATSDDPYAVALDTTGNAVLTGRFYGTSDFGTGPVTSYGQDAFLALYNTAGQALWFRHFGAQGLTVVGQHVAFDGGGDVIVAGTSDDVIDLGAGPRCAPGYGAPQAFLAKLDPQGQHLYSVCFGAPDGHFGDTKFVVDATGNVVFANRFTGTVDIGGATLTAPPTGAYAVAKIDPLGNVLWARAFGAGTAVASDFVGVAAAGDGGVVLTGDIQGTIDFGLGVLAPEPGDSRGAFLVKLDAGGNAVWSKLFSASSAAAPRAVSVGPLGNIVLSGTLLGDVSLGGELLHATGPYNLFLATFHADGAPLWSRVFASKMQDHSYGAIWGADDVITTLSLGGGVDLGCGSTEYPHPYGTGAAMVRWSASGVALGQRILLAFEPAGMAVVGGRTALTASINPFVLPDLGNGPLPQERGVALAVWGP